MPTPADRYSFLSQPRQAGPMGAYYRTMGGGIEQALRAAGDPNYSPYQSPQSLAMWGTQYRQGMDLSAPGAMAALPRAGQQTLPQAPVWAPTIQGAMFAPADAQAAAAQTAAWQAAGSPAFYNPTQAAPVSPMSNLSLYRPQPASAGFTAPLGSSLPNLRPIRPSAQQSSSQTAYAAPIESTPVGVTTPVTTPGVTAAPPGVPMPPMLNAPSTTAGAQQSQQPGEMPAPQEPSNYSLADLYGLKQDNPLINATSWT